MMYPTLSKGHHYPHNYHLSFSPLWSSNVVGFETYENNPILLDTGCYAGYGTICVPNSQPLDQFLWGVDRVCSSSDEG